MDPFLLGAIGTGGGALIDQNCASIKNQRKLNELQKKLQMQMYNQVLENQRNMESHLREEINSNRELLISEQNERDYQRLVTIRQRILYNESSTKDSYSDDPLTVIKRKYIEGIISDEEYLHLKKILEK